VRPAALIGVVCTAQVLAQIGGFTFAALLPVFFELWQLSHSDAGWLSGIFFGAYALSVPILLPLTDRFRARGIYVVCVGLTAASHLAMAMLACGFWSAMIFRALAGVGWAGTYMVGLRALTDELTGPAQSRAVALNAASIGVSGAISFALAGALGDWFGWQGAFVVSAAASVLALLIAVFAFPRGRLPSSPQPGLLDLMPVLRNRSAMAYSVGYCVHTWEMFVVRSWVVTYLTFVLAQQTSIRYVWLVPTLVAMLMELVGTISSVAGNELAMRLGRQRWVLCVMVVSMVMALGVGFSSLLGYGVTVVCCLLYNAAIYADSSAITAGTVGAADPDRKGSTLAVHALLGYGGGFIGPLVMGLVLDGLGGETQMNWGIGFGHLAIVMLVGPVALILLSPRTLPGDRRGKLSG
jgi:MFS family permease